MAVDVIAGGRVVTVEVKSEGVAILLLFDAGGKSGVFLRPSYVYPTFLLPQATKAGESDEIELTVSGFPQGTLRFEAAPFLAQVASASEAGETEVALTPENAKAWGLEP